MRIASFNLENLFSRARAMNLGTWARGPGGPGRLLPAQQPAAKTGLFRRRQTGHPRRGPPPGPGRRRRNRIRYPAPEPRRAARRPQNGPPEVAAAGRGDWIGWLELKTEAVNEIATEMTARVIQDVNPDILAVIEAEDRIALTRFNEQLLQPVNATFGGIMLIDGNNSRGIDVGILTKPGITIESMVSHVDDLENGQKVFSRDCPEYTLRVSETTTILLLINHFKSKGYGSQASSNARRKIQARRVRELYDRRRAEGIDRIAILGDFNDTPESDPLQPLLGDGSDLKDIFEHPQFQSDGRPGTFGNGTKSSKFDYILFSPALFACVTAGGVWRKGVWGGKNGTLFPHYPEMTKAVHAASDHAAIWADLDL